MNSRKREKPYFSRHAPYSLPKPKRRRPLPLDAVSGEDAIDASSAKAPTLVVVTGVPSECSVLDLKSRFEMYGPISRTRMEPNGVAYVKFRSNDAALSAVDAARDSSFPVTIHSIPVQVAWASDPVIQWKGGISKEGLSSRLVRAQVPLRRLGRGNRLGSTIVNPRDENINNERDESNQNKIDNDVIKVSGSALDGPFKGREIVAYDDIL
ncbi:RNA-binding (RRM/RBD/RNP motifs) family protein [Striga asiatica]|uniref:RNA-binding (RRM/RBD/RNP motifs) family protein n=1 Tax=Striga asiatica TaxID=4170 RepID=A0A5A7RFJ1_STRAF|nr:RNA-binding (RRM/RBD/RNP motifs) family protein [Striga asiatica]